MSSLEKRRSPPSSGERSATPRTSENGFDGSPALLACAPTAPRRRPPVRFSKWHALGNDYLLVERTEVGPLDPATVRRLCDVHTGIGADGVLEIVATHGPSAEVVIWNPDGSTAELSGNGTRIAARWLAAVEGSSVVRIRVGAREVVARMGDGLLVEQELGEIAVDPLGVIEVDGETVELTVVSVGNPHAVLRREPTRAELLRLGPAVERHPRFPKRT